MQVDLSTTEPPSKVSAAAKGLFPARYDLRGAAPTSAAVTGYGGPRIAYDRFWELELSGRFDEGRIGIIDPSTSQMTAVDLPDGGCDNSDSLYDLWWGPDGWLYTTLSGCLSDPREAELWRLENRTWVRLDQHARPFMRYLPGGSVLRVEDEGSCPAPASVRLVHAGTTTTADLPCAFQDVDVVS
jgi:hypothetical protein